MYHGFLSGLTNLLFGAIAGVSDRQVIVLAGAALTCLAVLAAIGRPLLWTSIDPAAAAARGVPVRLVAAAFLVVLGIAAASASQVTGSLLVFALLVSPAAAAQQLTARPALGIALSVLIALAVTWIGIGFAFFSPYPIGFWVASLGFGAYLLAIAYRRGAERVRDRVRNRAATAGMAAR